MYAIREIYKNSDQPSERNMCKNKKYRCAKNKVKQYYQLLNQRYTEYERTVLDKLMSYYDEQTDMKNMYCFEAGFRTGLAAAIESMGRNK